jgi:acetate kinase
MAAVLVINSGSSSVKYQVLDPHGPEVIARGVIERIGEGDDGVHHHTGRNGTSEHIGPVPDHDEAFQRVFTALGEQGGAGELVAVGHRVVHGGEALVEATVIDDDVLDGIRAQIPLAPLHNPANVAGIEVARTLQPDLPHVAVFDTAFHRTLPAHAYRYALPTELYEQHGIRRYGFHGTSHQYVAREAARLLGGEPEDCNMVTLHLGNGASATAVRGGRSVDTSMGLSPLEGLVMGTRSGDVDPAVVFHLVREAGMTLDEVETLLNRRSGLKGLAGANDLRELEHRTEAGDEAAQLALDVYCHRIRKYVGAFAAVLGRLDAVVFTGGVGEHSVLVRARVCEGLEVLGLQVDATRNADAVDGRETAIQSEDSRVAVLVIPTDEELEIARQTLLRIGGDDG